MAEIPTSLSSGSHYRRLRMDEPHPFEGLERPIAFLDSETTGLGPEAQVWDLGFLVAHPSGDLVEYQSFMYIDPLHADPIALDIGHYWDRSPHSPVRKTRTTSAGTSQATVAIEAFRLLHGATLAGIVPSADATWVSRLLALQGHPVPWHYKLFDVHTFATGVLAVATGQDTTLWSTEQVSEALGLTIAPEHRHTALGDADLAFQMYVESRRLAVERS